MAPGAAGDDKSKEEEKKVSKQKVSKLDKIDNFAGQEVGPVVQTAVATKRRGGGGTNPGRRYFPLVIVSRRSLSCPMFYSCNPAVIRC